MNFFPIERIAVVTGCWMMLCMISGCGGNTDDRPPVEISGTITLDGAILEAGSIHFSSSKTGETAYSNLDDQGQYSLKFPKADFDTPYEIKIGPPVIDEQDAHALEENPPQKMKQSIPRKYTNRTTSELTAKLTAEEKQTFDFDLKSE